MSADRKSESKKLRLFVGTFLGEEERTRLAELADKHGERLSLEWDRKVRWVKPEKLHITWIFLGEHEETVVDPVLTRLGALLKGQEPFSLSYELPVFWPSPRKARMCALVPGTVSDEVSSLGSKVRRALREFTEKEEKKFRPHLTLFRLGQANKQRMEIPDWMEMDRILPIRHDIRSINLIQSHLGSENDAYESVAAFQLNG